MQVILFKDKRRNKGKYHVEHSQVECYAGIEVSAFDKRRIPVFIDVEETQTTGYLHVQLLDEDISWNRDDEICVNCSKNLEKIIKSGKELRELR